MKYIALLGVLAACSSSPEVDCRLILDGVGGRNLAEVQTQYASGTPISTVMMFDASTTEATDLLGDVAEASLSARCSSAHRSLFLSDIDRALNLPDTAGEPCDALLARIDFIFREHGGALAHSYTIGDVACGVPLRPFLEGLLACDADLLLDTESVECSGTTTVCTSCVDENDIVCDGAWSSAEASPDCNQSSEVRASFLAACSNAPSVRTTVEEPIGEVTPEQEAFDRALRTIGELLDGLLRLQVTAAVRAEALSVATMALPEAAIGSGAERCVVRANENTSSAEARLLDVIRQTEEIIEAICEDGRCTDT